MVEDTRSYYWLGFTAERSLDDESRRIEVTALRPGLEVRSRQGYLDLSREAEVSAATESLLLFEQGTGIVAEPLPIRPGAAKVVVSVFDPLSGRLLASRMRIDPKAVLD